MCEQEALRLEKRVNDSICPAWYFITAHARRIPGEVTWEVLLWNSYSGYITHCQDYALFADSVREAIR